jgi:hypothetical protein
MSTDYEAVCDVCRMRCHVGQIMADRASFGYGPTDADGIAYAAAFVMKHADCGELRNRGVRVIVSDRDWTDISDDYTNEEYG